MTKSNKQANTKLECMAEMFRQLSGWWPNRGADLNNGKLLYGGDFRPLSRWRISGRTDDIDNTKLECTEEISDRSGPSSNNSKGPERSGNCSVFITSYARILLAME